MPQTYSFISRWQVNAPIEDVWKLIYDSEKWPEWWPSVVEVKEIHTGDSSGIGSIRSYKMRSPMLYTLSFNLKLTAREDLKLLKGNASGDLEGIGAWYVSEKEGVTDIQCHWRVSTTKWWMNSFAFVLKPLFRYNHSAVMKDGGLSLGKQLNTSITIIS